MRTRTSRVLWLGAALASVSAGCVLSAQMPQSITVQPGQNIQQTVDNAPEGTRFVFAPGIYRQQTIIPKNRQEFIGQDGVVLNGAMALTAWTKVAGLWQTDGLPAPLDFHGDCEDDRELCNRREDLFVNGRVYQRTPSLAGLGAGAVVLRDGRAWLADDPTGRLVELSVTPVAFAGDAEDVVLEHLIVEKYASDAQQGAINLDRARGWLVVRRHGALEPRRRAFSSARRPGSAAAPSATTASSASAGPARAPRSKAWRSRTTTTPATIPAGKPAAPSSRAPGTWSSATSCVHHNAGPGLWTDIDNIGVLYEGNNVFLNTDDGIKHEISYDAIIRNNVVAHNGTSGFDVWLVGLANPHPEQRQRRGLRQSGRGVRPLRQRHWRSSIRIAARATHGPWHAVNNSIHDNTIIHLGSRGQNGVVMDTDDDWYWNEADNRFDLESVHRGRRRGAATGPRTAADGGWDHIQDLGLERNGELIVEQRAPMELSCR